MLRFLIYKEIIIFNSLDVMKNTISDILNRECYGIQKIIYSNMGRFKQRQPNKGTIKKQIKDSAIKTERDKILK